MFSYLYVYVFICFVARLVALIAGRQETPCRAAYPSAPHTQLHHFTDTGKRFPTPLTTISCTNL